MKKNKDLLESEPKRFEEKHYSPKDLAKAWGLSAEKIRQLFRDEPGVLKIGNKNPQHQRPYLTLRIPESVAECVHNRLSAVARKI
jgi:hypothetical protein